MKNKKGLIIAIVIVAVVLCLSCCCCSSILLGSSNNKDDEVSESVPSTAATTEETTNADVTEATEESTEISTSSEEKSIVITSGVLGEYGRVTVLNKDTDMPAEKYLYKLPAGNYTVTTTYQKLAAFYVVKDEIAMTGSSEYPEELQYVSEGYMLTAGENDFNGTAKKIVEISLAEDESISIPNSGEEFIITPVG
ncbi:MAG: hypothetical protein Q4A05_03250 [Ruminococcus sp.]|nr:hypothetical protein [Ruminococcus sp.]